MVDDNGNSSSDAGSDNSGAADSRSETDTSTDSGTESGNGSDNRSTLEEALSGTKQTDRTNAESKADTAEKGEGKEPSGEYESMTPIPGSIPRRAQPDTDTADSSSSGDGDGSGDGGSDGSDD